MTWSRCVLELLEGQRPVVERRRQAEAEVDQDLLAGAVVLVHAHDLGDGHVALVHDQQPVGREVVEQRPGPRARPRGGTGAGSSSRCPSRSPARASSRRRRWSAGGAARPRGPCPWPRAPRPAASASASMSTMRFLELVRGRHVVRGGVDVELVALGEQLAGDRVELRDALDLVAEELDPDDEVVVGGLELEGVAADPELGARQRLVVALVLEVDQLAQDAVAPIAAARRAAGPRSRRSPRARPGRRCS